MQCRAKLAKVTHISIDHLQAVHDSCRRDGHAFSDRVRLPVLEPCPLPEGGCVHKQYTSGSQDFIRSGLQLLQYHIILLADILDPCLFLSNPTD